MSNLLDASLANLLTPKEFPRTLIITVGNCFRADDGVGPYIASCLVPSKKLSVINAGYMPENIIDQVAKLSPQRIIFIDAADFGGAPGELCLIDAEHIPETSLSTHSVPLPLISRILHEDTKAQIYFIGIQPESVQHREGLSVRVESAAEELIKHINQEFAGDSADA
ncbi:MAG: hydrogenase 3 maturation endopeptidase HyCI [Candidatus Omnitrophota bacterium]